MCVYYNAVYLLVHWFVVFDNICIFPIVHLCSVFNLLLVCVGFPNLLLCLYKCDFNACSAKLDFISGCVSALICFVCCVWNDVLVFPI